MNIEAGTRNAPHQRGFLAALAAILMTLFFSTNVWAVIDPGSAATGQNTAAGSSALTINKPSTTITGDLLLAQITFHTGTIATIVPPAGWTEVLRTNNTTDLGQAIYRKIAGPSEPAAYTWTFSSGITRAAGGIANYRGVDQAAPIGATSGNFGNGTTLTALSVEAEKDSRLVVNLGVRESTTITRPAGFTFRFLQRQPTSGKLMILSEDQPRNAGPTGDKVSTSEASDFWTAQQVILRTDATGPTVVISSTAANPTSSSPIPVTVQFSEPVNGFTAEDIEVTNGTVGNFTGGFTDFYTFDVTPSGPGEVTVNIAAGVAQDPVGNPNTAATPFSRTFDSSSPTVTISSSSPNPTSDSPIPVVIQFSEVVTGFEASEIAVTNGTVGNFVAVDGDTYTFDLTPGALGEVTVNIPAGVAQDADGSPNTAAAPFSRTYGSADTTGPTVVISSTTTDPTSDSPIPVTVQFSEFVNGFEASDIAVTNGTVSSFTTKDGDTYIFNVTPGAPGEVTVNIAAGVAQDESGNPNSAAAPFTRTFGSINNTPPTVTVSSPSPDPTSDSPIPVTVQFSELVNGFEASDIAITNGTVSNFVGVDGDTYTFNLLPSAPGEVTVNIAAGVAQDADGNSNTAAAPFSRTFVVDSTRPTVTINQAAGQADPTNSSIVSFTVVFSEPVTGFTGEDVTLEGTAGATTAVVTEVAPNDGTTYNVAVSGMTTSGNIVASLAANVANSAGGSGNQPSTSTDNVVTYMAYEGDFSLKLPYVARH